MPLTIPELSLVVVIGPSGSGKSTFARQHFRPTEVLSSDFCRGLVSDDENDQAATKDAFEVLHYIAAKRLQAGRLTVVDATNVQLEARKPLVALAREYNVLPVAIVLDLPEQLCQARNRERADRDFGPHVVRQQHQQMRRSLRGLQREGFRHVFVLDSLEKIAAATIERQPLWNNRKFDHGPFDIIGDVHGCYDELETLLQQLGYVTGDGGRGIGDGERETGVKGQQTGNEGVWHHPEGRKAVFVGDLVDRGPRTPDVLRLVMGMVAAGTALCVPGNHDIKLMRKLRGKDVQVGHGLAESLAQLAGETGDFREQVATFLDGLVSHYVLDDGKLVVAHAGMKEALQGRGSGKVRDFALFGETSGETDEFGLPIRYNWAAEYRGKAMVVYGHTPVPAPELLNHTINIDTGCVFGGKLTALRYPEKELVAVPSARTYAEPSRPFLPPVSEVEPLTAQQQLDNVLDLEDVLGKRLITTRLHHNVTIREENAITALEVMSRFAANPQWLIYLPPTMSPSETSKEPGLLEHPQEAFRYFQHNGVPQVVCEAKHMGSRAVIVVCRDEAAAHHRFGVVGEGIGICYTRTGRRFFEDTALEQGLLERVRDALSAAGFWDEFQTEWACLDCELMPWSAKAQDLLRQQYAAVGAASRAALAQVVPVLDQAVTRGVELGELMAEYQTKASLADQYVAVYRHYCWPVQSLNDLKLAPFHLLATEGKVHVDQDHVWHMETLAKVCREAEQLLLATPYQIVTLGDGESEAQAIAWWQAMTDSGGEGMVVKPRSFVAHGQKGLVQPAIKCRGREYLRLIYGQEYTLPSNLERLRQRGLATKRSLAQREFALGIEALERWVQREPLRRVHECVFGVLALESEPVDPRL